jgi:predicted RNA binding protein YcfA (HicA-like mRNA interferase family)
MKALSGKEFCKLLESKGWHLARINGSHHIYAKQGSIVRISVPVHANKSLKMGLQKAMMKSADITDADL